MDLFKMDSVSDLFETVLPQSSSLQRNDAWFEQRRGKFTGSEIDKLMGCSRSTSKMEWGRPEKIIDYNETAKKYIFGKAKERQRGKVLRRSIGKNGDFGTNAEPIIIKLLQEKYPDAEIEKVGFIEFIQDIAGASPDGKFNSFGLEIKAAMEWSSLYLRYETIFDQSHQDFWQIQSEMLALETDELMYVISEPPEDIDHPEITDINEKMVKASPIHQTAIIQRCMIGNAAIELYLEGVGFQEAIRMSCTEFEF